MVFCEHCEITLVRQSHQSKDCGFDTRYLGGPGPFFSGPFCCNCAKEHHGWSIPLFNTYACQQCKARGKDAGKRTSDEKALSDEEAQWEAYFLRESNEHTGEHIGKSQPPGAESLPQGPVMVQRHILAPPKNDGLVTQGSPSRTFGTIQGEANTPRGTVPEASVTKTPRGTVPEASVTPRRTGLASMAPEARRGDVDVRRAQEAERREQERREVEKSREERREDRQRAEERRESERRAEERREAERRATERRDVQRETSYLNREALREHTTSYMGRERDRDGRGVGMEPRRPHTAADPRQRERRESSRAVETSVLASYGLEGQEQEKANRVSLSRNRVVFVSFACLGCLLQKSASMRGWLPVQH